MFVVTTKTTTFNDIEPFTFRNFLPTFFNGFLTIFLRSSPSGSLGLRDHPVT